jgi:hypothetical protein
MTADFAYDPVTAIDEAKAVGETAALFAEIRQVMRIPLVTSIWRALAGIDDSLHLAWAAVKPIYESDEPERALMRSVAAVGLPRPESLAPTAFACVGLTEGDIVAARAVVAAYNRSNGLNLMALAAFIAPSATGATTAPAAGVVASLPNWPQLPPLLPREAIGADTWDMIRHVNGFGSSGVDASVATLWRHLAHWPALLALIHGAFAPLQSRGLIAEANARLVALSSAEGARMAHLGLTSLALSRQACATITGYVGSPSQVVRMVTMAMPLLSGWIDTLHQAGTSLCTSQRRRSRAGSRLHYLN